MRLVRLTLIEFEPFPKVWHTFRMNFYGVNLGTITPWSNKDKGYVFIAADVPLQSRPELTENNTVIIPDKARLRAEEAIEKIVDTISIAEQCKRHITSPIPSVVFMPESEEEWVWLSNTDGILTEYTHSRARALEAFDLEKYIPTLEDRWGGVALLAEAFSHEQAAGKFHEFIRLFELAFKLPFGQQAKPLFEFLKNTKLEYAESEVKRWIELRHPSVHADLNRQTHFTLEADIRPAIFRIEQAAYDILLNKAQWHDPSSKRRDTWDPTTAITSDTGIRLTRGEPAHFTFSLVDEFGSYSLNIQAYLSKLPDFWWYKEYKPSQS